MLQREPEGIIAGLIVLWLQRPLSPLLSGRLTATPKKKSNYFAANVVLCFLKLGEKMSLLNRIYFYRTNVFLLSSSNPAKLVIWFGKRLQRHPVLPDKVWVVSTLQLVVFV